MNILLINLCGHSTSNQLSGASAEKAFSLFNILSLAIGVCLFFLSLEFYNYNRGFNRFHSQADHLYRVGISGARKNSIHFSNPRPVDATAYYRRTPRYPFCGQL